MKLNHLRIWFLGVVAYLVFLLAEFPAVYLTHWMSGHVTGLQLAGVSGSLFAGQADMVRFGRTDLGTVQWDFDWWAPFTGALGYRLHAHTEDHDLQGRVDDGLGGMQLHDLKGRMPVTALDAWLPLPSNSLHGSLVLDLKQLRFKAGKLQSAQGHLELDDAVISWPTSYTLGSFRMDLSPAEAGGVDATIADVASPLKIQASLDLTPQGQYHIKGVLAARDPGDASARTLLANLGRPDSTGQYPFDFKGQW